MGDVRDVNYRTNLIDTFVHKIVLYDDDSGTYLDIFSCATPKATVGSALGCIKIPLDEPFALSKGILLLFLLIFTKITLKLCESQRVYSRWLFTLVLLPTEDSFFSFH